MKQLILAVLLCIASLAFGQGGPSSSNYPPGGLAANNSFSGTNTFLGQIQCKDLEAVKCVDSANSQGWTGTDIGGWINAAYAALPSNGGEIHVFNLGNACINFTTQIAFTTSGKFIRLIGHGSASYGSGTPIGGACLNWTTTTASTALKVDYVPIGTASGFGSGHGIRDITLMNNGCVTSGGCASSAVGIQWGSTNLGASGADFERVALIGFGTGHDDSNVSANVPGETWTDPFFWANTVAMTPSQKSPMVIRGGLFINNNGTFQAVAVNGGEVVFDGTTFISNFGPVLDFTRNLSRYLVTCLGCHFEDSPTTSATTPNFVSGLTDMRIYGGIMETDQTTGTQNWFASIAATGLLEIHGMELISGGKTFTQAFLLNTTARGNIQVSNASPATITTMFGGAGAAASFSAVIASNTTSSTTTPQLSITNLLISNTAPTIAGAGCGGSAATIPSNNGTAAFTVNVGTAPTSPGCTITLPAATTDWVCSCQDRTTNSTALSSCQQTNSSASTTSVVLQGFSDIAGAAAFVANDILRVKCVAY